MIETYDIERLTLENNNFRKVLITENNLQLVLMSLKLNEEIGMEVHDTVDQFFRIEQGNGKLIIRLPNMQLVEKSLIENTVFIVPKGTYHNIVNTGSIDMKLYTIYSPPNHPDKTIHDKNPEKIHDGGYFKKKYELLRQIKK